MNQYSHIERVNLLDAGLREIQPRAMKTVAFVLFIGGIGLVILATATTVRLMGEAVAVMDVVK